MCGRFAFTSPVEAVAALFNADASRLPEIAANTNVCPTQNIVSLVTFQGQKILSSMRWGFIPHWYKAHNDGPLLINARAETIVEKPAYRDAFQNRRCVIPLNWYYEWSSKNPENKKSKYKISDPESAMLACAGIWQAWRDADGNRIITCAMLTKESTKEIAPIHHRMPVILSKNDIDSWLNTHQSATFSQILKNQKAILGIKAVI